MPLDLITEIPRLHSLSLSKKRRLIHVSMREDIPWAFMPSILSCSTKLVHTGGIFELQVINESCERELNIWLIPYVDHIGYGIYDHNSWLELIYESMHGYQMHFQTIGHGS